MPMLYSKPVSFVDMLCFMQLYLFIELILDLYGTEMNRLFGESVLQHLLLFVWLIGQLIVYPCSAVVVHNSSLQCYTVLSTIAQLLRKMKLKNLVS